MKFSFGSATLDIFIQRIRNTGHFTILLNNTFLPPPSTSHLSMLLAEFPEVLNASKILTKVKRAVVHHIKRGWLPCDRQVQRRLNTAKLEATKREFLELEQQGIMRRYSIAAFGPLLFTWCRWRRWHLAPVWQFFGVLNYLQANPDFYTCPPQKNC